MACIGLHWPARGVAVIIVRGQNDSPVAHELVTLILEKVGRYNIRADVFHRDSIESAITAFIPIPDIGQGQTDRKLARASRRIKELDEDNFAGEVSQPHGRAISEAGTRPRRPRV